MTRFVQSLTEELLYGLFLHDGTEEFSRMEQCPS